MLIIPLSWSGRGPLMMVCVLLGLVTGIVIAFFAREPGRGAGTVGPWPFALGFALAAAVNLLLGLWLNRRAARTVVDPRTGAAAIAPAEHRFWGLRMEWWSLPILALAALFYLSPDEPERRPRGPGVMAPAPGLPKD